MNSNCNQNNAAQAANTNPLSDEYVNAVIQQHGYDSPECVIARLHQWIGLHGGENGLTLLMYEAHKALSKLRAPVADEDDQPTAPDDDSIAECWVSASDCDGIAYDGPSFERGYRTALASAPVAREADQDEMERQGWVNIGYKHDLEKARRAISFCNIPGFDGMSLDSAIYWLRNQVDNAAPQASKPDFADAYEGAREDLAIWKQRARVAEHELRAERETSSRLVAVLNAESGPTHMGEPAPQASEAVRDALEMLIREAQAVADDYHRPRYARLDDAILSARAALSAQPGAQKEQSDA